MFSVNLETGYTPEPIWIFKNFL